VIGMKLWAITILNHFTGREVVIEVLAHHKAQAEAFGQNAYAAATELPTDQFSVTGSYRVIKK
jgi:hypothetical protein